MPEFTELLTRVKPAKRTDKYVLLAALYFQQAHRKPVTTGAISDLLKLNLNKKDQPTNPATSLKSYKGDVALKGTSPHTWFLTASGVKTFYGLSGLSGEEAKATQGYKTDIVFICALENPEQNALIAALDGKCKWTEETDGSMTHVYRRTTIPLESAGELTAVSTTATTMGLTAAAIATSQAIMLFRPRLVVMVGIAAGTRKGGKQFGDVLVADPSVDYNSGKVVDVGGVREFEPDPYPVGVNSRLRALLNKYQGREDAFAGIRSRWKGKLPYKGNRLHVGPLGAADQVIDDPSKILEIQKDWRKLIGVEMETYAVYRACQEAPEPKPRVVSFKAVCDFAAEKTDSWQAYAAFVAANFAIDFIRAEWTSMWSSAKSGEDE